MSGKSTEAYGKFIENLCGEQGEKEVMLNNYIVDQCVKLGFYHGMSEIETLRAAILLMIKISDAETERKIKTALTSEARNWMAEGGVENEWS